MNIGYCTNVHPGRDLAMLWDQLEQVTRHVHQGWSSSADLPIGLWLSQAATQALLAPETLQRFRTWLADCRLRVASLNGFPYGDFHQPRVKYAVYEPDWADPRRLIYTCRLADILAELLPEGGTGSISTLPICWGQPRPDQGHLARAAAALRQAAEYLQGVHRKRGRKLILCLEPEPGCYLQTSRDLITFLENYLFDSPMEDTMRSHLGACHDLCHAAVMFEGPAAAWQQYLSSGIAIPKVQISSAIRVLWDMCAADLHDAVLSDLRRFAEERYLHQTMIHVADQYRFLDDLGQALSQQPRPLGEWRIHFHVPVFANRLGHLHTTQADTIDWLVRYGKEAQHQGCFLEVETYAWNVLPHDLWSGTLAEGIIRELEWVELVLTDLGGQVTTLP